MMMMMMIIKIMMMMMIRVRHLFDTGAMFYQNRVYEPAQFYAHELLSCRHIRKYFFLNIRIIDFTFCLVLNRSE